MSRIAPDWPPRPEILAAWLRWKAGAKRARVSPLQRLEGGAIHYSWRFEATLTGGPFDGRHCLVLRAAEPPPHPDSLSLRQEAEILAVALRASVPAPEPLWLGDESDGFDGPVLALRWIDGEADPAKLVAASEDNGAGLARNIGQTLARIHAVSGSGIAALGKAPIDPARIALDRLTVRLRSERPRPVLEQALDFFWEQAPRGRPVVPTHGDFRASNLVVSGDRVAAVLDWEFAHWSDPIEDYGWFTARCWRRHCVEREAGGLGPLEAFEQGYREGGGAPPDADLLRFWQAYAHLRWAGIAMGQIRRGQANGRADLVSLESRLPEIERELLQLVS